LRLGRSMEMVYRRKRRGEKFEAVVKDMTTIDTLSQSHSDLLHSEYSSRYLFWSLQMLQQLLDNQTPVVRIQIQNIEVRINVIRNRNSRRIYRTEVPMIMHADFLKLVLVLNDQVKNPGDVVDSASLKNS